MSYEIIILICLFKQKCYYLMKKIGTNFVWYGGMKINKWNTEKRVEIMMTKKKNRRKTVKNCEESKRDKEEKEVD